jgi:hypothetical protein
MPILASIYAVLFCIIALESVYDNIKARQPRWYVAIDVVADVAVLLMFIGHWRGSLVRSIGWAAPCLFFGCLVWRLYWLPTEIRQLRRDLVSEDGALFERLKGLIYGAVALLMIPSYWFGGMAALGYYDHT